MFLEIVNAVQIAGFFGQPQRVPAVPGSFADAHLSSAQRPKRLQRRRNHRHIGIDRRRRIELDEVRLQQHALAAHVETA